MNQALSKNSSSLIFKMTCCFSKTLEQVLAICLQILFSDQCQSHQNNLAICIFMAPQYEFFALTN